MKDFNGNQIEIDWATPLCPPLPRGELKGGYQGGEPLTDQELRIVAAIQRGREQAISMPALAAAVGVKTRELQTIIAHLIEEHGVLIASATGKGKGDTKRHGYYYPVTEAELISARTQIIHRIQSLARRLRAIDREAFEEIFNQKRLDYDEFTKL